MQRRCKPLLTCAMSMFAIASRAYTRTRDLDGPIGSTTKKMANFSTPILPFYRLLKTSLLAILLFADDRILSLEKIVQTLFPPSTRLFDKVDDYARVVEDLPTKLDDVLDKFPTIVHRVPFLDWALVYMISWLKLFVSVLSRFGSNTSREREIVVDTSDSNHRNEKEPISEYKSIFAFDHSSLSHLSVSSNYETKKENPKGEQKAITPPIISDITKCSYKEVLKKGTNEGNENNEHDNYEVSIAIIKPEGHRVVVANENKNSERNGNNDPILDLFETSWHMKQPKVDKKSSISPSASYT